LYAIHGTLKDEDFVEKVQAIGAEWQSTAKSMLSDLRQRIFTLERHACDQQRNIAELKGLRERADRLGAASMLCAGFAALKSSVDRGSLILLVDDDQCPQGLALLDHTNKRYRLRWMSTNPVNLGESPQARGVGKSILAWASHFSKRKGFRGKVYLFSDSSATDYYLNLGLRYAKSKKRSAPPLLVLDRKTSKTFRESYGHLKQTLSLS
jgi:hypothetical protein